MRSSLLAALLAVGTVAGASAESPLVAELSRVSVSYHKDPARLDTLRDALERTAAADPRVEHLMALAEVSFIWADVRAQTRAEKLQAYDRGRNAARLAMDAEPRNVGARFWFATNTARWGQTNGLMRSLFLLPDVKREVRAILDLDSGYTPVYVLAGNVYYEVPGLLGGDLAKAEEMFRAGLAQDPRFTGLRVGLGKTLIKRRRLDEARRELTAVLEETAPRNPATWAVKDAPEARGLLEKLRTRS